MDLPPEILEIERRLESGEIEPSDAVQRLIEIKGSTRPPWQSKEWKRERATIIGDACVQCGSDRVLVLQHTVPRRSWPELFEAAEQSNPGYLRRRETREADLEWRILHEKASQVPVERPVCPDCYGKAVYFRKRTNDWKCTRKSCGIVFEQPSTVMALSPQQEREIRAFRHSAKRKMWAEDREDKRMSVSKDAALLYISDLREYLALTNVTTFCKKCAYLWDKHGKLLCPMCKATYTSMGSPCSSCFEDNEAEADNIMSRRAKNAEIAMEASINVTTLAFVLRNAGIYEF